MLAVTLQRYPEATANQLVQSLIRNTDREPHELEYDAASGYGYGAAWLTSLLAVDPSQFPDESSLMEKTTVPTQEQVDAAAARGSVYPPVTEKPNSFGEYEDDAAPANPAGDVIGGVALPLALAGGGALIIGVVVVVVILTRRRRGRPGHASLAGLPGDGAAVTGSAGGDR